MDIAANYGALILTLLGPKFKFPDNHLTTSDMLINFAVMLAASVVFAHVFSTLITMSDFVRQIVQSILSHVIFTAMSLLVASFVLISIDKTEGNVLEMDHSLMAINITLVFFPIAGAVPLRCCGSAFILEKFLSYVFKGIWRILVASCKYLWNNPIKALVLVFVSVFDMFLLMKKGGIPALVFLSIAVISIGAAVALFAVLKFLWPPTPPHPHSV